MGRSQQRWGLVYLVSWLQQVVILHCRFLPGIYPGVFSLGTKPATLPSLCHGACGAAAVHDDVRPRDVVRAMTRQEQHRAHKVLWLRQALEGDAVDDVLDLLGAVEDAGAEGRVGGAGQHAVDVDVVGRPGERERLGQRQQRALWQAMAGQRVGAEEGEWPAASAQQHPPSPSLQQHPLLLGLPLKNVCRPPSPLLRPPCRHAPTPSPSDVPPPPPSPPLTPLRRSKRPGGRSRAAPQCCS